MIVRLAGAGAAFAFMLLLANAFLRYSYVPAAQNVWRVDRLTGASCVLPCAPPRPASTNFFEDIIRGQDHARWSAVDCYLNKMATENISADDLARNRATRAAHGCD